MITFYTDKEGKRRVSIGSATPRRSKMPGANRAQRRRLVYTGRIKDKIFSLRKDAKEAGITLPRTPDRLPHKKASGYYSTLLNIVRRELSHERNALCEEV